MAGELVRVSTFDRSVNVQCESVGEAGEFAGSVGTGMQWEVATQWNVGVKQMR